MIGDHRAARSSSSLLALLAFVLPGSAHAAWEPLAPLAVSDRITNRPEVALDPRGNAVFVWRRFDGSKTRIEGRRRLANGGMTQPRFLSLPGQQAYAPQVAVDNDGNATVIWETRAGVRGRRFNADGTLGEVEALADDRYAERAALAVDPSGRSVVTWVRFIRRETGLSSEVRGRDWENGVLGPVRRLSRPGDYALSPRVALDRRGNAIFVWDGEERLTGHASVWARSLSAAGQLGALEVLYSSNEIGAGAYEPVVGLDSRGNAVVGWRLDCYGGPCRMQVRRRSMDGALGPTLSLSGKRRYVFDHDLAVTPEGEAIVIWEESFGRRLLMRRLTNDDALTPLQSLVRTPSIVDDPEMGVAGDGDAIVIWRNLSNHRVQVRQSFASGSLGPLQNLSADGERSNQPDVAVNRRGDAVAAWRARVGRQHRIQAAVGP